MYTKYYERTVPHIVFLYMGFHIYEERKDFNNIYIDRLHIVLYEYQLFTIAWLEKWEELWKTAGYTKYD